MEQKEIDKLNIDSALENGNHTAFPIESDGYYHHGLTKREYIATQFMAAAISSGFGQQSDAIAVVIKMTDNLLIELNKNK